MRQLGDRIRLPDGRRGIVVGVSEPVVASVSPEGRLLMEKHRELEVEVWEKNGKSVRVFVRDREGGGLSLVHFAIGFAVGMILFLCWLVFW